MTCLFSGILVIGALYCIPKILSRVLAKKGLDKEFCFCYNGIKVDKIIVKFTKNMLKTLQKLGLNEKEAKVYLANLELGPAKIPEIAEKSGIKRTTVYVVIESLMQKGLISFFQSKKTKRFVAEEPRKLKLLLKEKEDALKQAMPQLDALTKTEKEKRPEVRFYRGQQGCISVLEQSLEKSNSEVLAIGSVDNIYRVVSREYDRHHYIPTRLKKKIKFKALWFKDKESLDLKVREKRELREVKFLPQDYFFPSFMLIFQDKIALVSSEKEFIGVVIQSPDLVKMEEQKFKLLWDKL